MAADKDKQAQKERERFVRETVVSSRNRGKRLAKRIAAVVLSALVFGALSAFIFVVTKPFWESRFGEPETSSQEVVTIFEPTVPDTTAEAVSTEPSTEEPSAEPSTEETTAESEPESTEAATDPYAGLWESIRPDVDGEIDSKLAEVLAGDALAQQRRAAAAAVGKSLVTVSARNAATDWFDNDLTHKEEQSGVIIAVTGRDILVLTDADILSEEQQLYAIFANSLQVPAELRGVDETFGLAVLAVDRITWTSEQLEGVSPIEMGNSSAMGQGQTVIAMGAPMGAGSMLSGSIARMIYNAQGTDTTVRLFQTDIAAPKDANGFLVNLNGQMVGWITRDYTDYRKSGFLSAIALYDLTLTIERLSNGEESALLGIRGQNVTTTMSAEYELPRGIYISRCISDTPADRAGIQNGDILTAVGSMEITTFKDLTAVLNSHRPGDTVTLVVQRQIGGEYTALEMEAVLDSR